MSSCSSESLLEALAEVGRYGKLAPAVVTAASQRFVSEMAGRPGSGVERITLFGMLGLSVDQSPWHIGHKSEVLLTLVLTNGRVVAGHFRSTPVTPRTTLTRNWNCSAVQRLAAMLATQPRDSAHEVQGLGELHRGPYEQLRAATVCGLSSVLMRALSGQVPAKNRGRRIAATVAAAERFARAKLEAGLQADWLEACPRQDMDARITGYNFLSLRDPTVRPLYLQALGAYPFLWASLFEHDHPVVAELRAAIASRRPMSDLVNKLLDAKPWQVGRLRDAVVQELIDPALLRDHDAVLRLIRGLDHIAPERVPTTRPGWIYFGRVLADLPFKAWIAALAEVGFDRLGANHQVPAAWRSWVQRRGLGRELSALEDFYDYTRRYPLQGLLPLDHATNLRAMRDAHTRWRRTVNPAVLAYYYDRALPRHLREGVPAPWGADWDDDQSRGIGWLALISEPVEFAGYRFVELTTPHSLRLEGYQLRHCVGTYADRCASGRSRIFSMRGTVGTEPSTLELRRAGRWVVGQHCATANAPPSDKATGAAQQFVRWINERGHGSKTAEQGSACGAPSP
jgi:hypothetical protein